jgi:hypothetical protein
LAAAAGTATHEIATAHAAARHHRCMLLLPSEKNDM